MEDLQNLAQQICNEDGHRLVYFITCGSHAYGTNTETSDHDSRGVFVPSWAGLVGLNSVDTIERTSIDLVLKTIREFVRLCAQGNPNILDWLFVPDNCVHIVDPLFKKYVLDIRDQFLSKQLHARFRGYAYSNLQKMRRPLSRELGVKRKADIEAHGYSTKNAMHLIRLARMGCEVLETGKYTVYREDREELLRIKNGEMPLEEIEKLGADLLVRLDVALETSPLPAKPAIDFINVNLINMTLALKRYC